MSDDMVLINGNASVIPTYDYRTHILLFGSPKYNCKFLIDDVTLLIPIAYFLSHFHILIDIAHLWLVNIVEYESMLTVNRDSNSSTLLQSTQFNFTLHISSPADAYAHLFTSYPEVFHPENNIIVFSSSKEERLRHLHIMLDHLQQNSLVVRCEKFTFGANEVSFLEHCITPLEVQPLSEKVAAIQNFPTHSKVKAL
ncbi:uncharacterized protein [Palaemon carinicauda]|uniref:uncharacterized protein n=1 Tax=Palaemon carinicauda TaxID=392227 RepID=UPI0035B5C3DD